MHEPDTVKEINLLPVNSFELDIHLSDLGLSLAAFAKEYDFSRKCFGIEDCDLVQCVLIEFIASLKPYAIPFLAVSTSGYAPGQKVTINSQHHTEEFITETALNAMQSGFAVEEKFSALFWWRQRAVEIVKKVKAKLFLLRERYRYARIGMQTIPVAKPGQFRLLLSTYHPNTIFTLTPVQDALGLREDVFQLYMANRIETFYKLKQLGYSNIINARAFPSKRRVTVNENIYDEFIDLYFNDKSGLQKLTSRFKMKFKETLWSWLGFAVTLYSPLKELFLLYKPQTLLVSSSSTLDAQILIHLAKGTKTRTLEMTHGMFQDTPILKMQNIPLKLVWSQYQKDLMKKYSSHVTCEVVGNPHQDVLLGKFGKTTPKRYTEKNYVLLISSPGKNTSLSWITYLAVLRDFITVAKQFPHMEFVFKLHPSDNFDLITNKAKEMTVPGNFHIEKKFDVYSLLFHADIVVVITSSVGFEALLWKKKLICYQVANSERWIPFGKFGLAKNASNSDELKAQINYFLEKENMVTGNSNADYFSFSDGKALERIIDFTIGK
jgi:hypothetical protein